MPLFYVALLPNVVGASLNAAHLGVLMMVIVAVEMVVIAVMSSSPAAPAACCARQGSYAG
jgi:threonine/homoserine/homoserine lactone efflux protein